MRKLLAAPGAVIASAALHAVILGAGAWFWQESRPDSAEPASPIEVTTEEVADGLDLPPMFLGGTEQPDPDAKTRPEPVTTGGGQDEPRPDTRRAGRGGDDGERALNLADNIDGLTLDRDDINDLTRSQAHRLKTSRLRQSWDDRRATPNPMQLSFLASGQGARQERRRPSRYDPSRGVLFGSEAASEGSRLGGFAAELGGDENRPGGARVGSARQRDGAGVRDGAPDRRFHRSARVTLARASVPRARAAVPANRRARPHDTTDSSQEVANAVRSLVHASSAGGRKRTGAGGKTGPGAPGNAGKKGPGSRSKAAGAGGGPRRASGLDPRLWRYLRALKRQVDPYWENAFPDWAIEEGRGGLAIVSLTVTRTGHATSVKVVRTSGIKEFDDNLLAAVLRASPFGPLPPKLGKSQLSVNITFDALNPAVGRRGM